MDDDIDIEEHDILEHPQIKKLFPDFSQVKLEVHENDYLFQDLPFEDHLNSDQITEEQEIIIPDIKNTFTETNAIEESIEISDDTDVLPRDPEGISGDPDGIPDDPDGIPDDPCEILDDPEEILDDPDEILDDPDGLPVDPSINEKQDEFETITDDYKPEQDHEKENFRVPLRFQDSPDSYAQEINIKQEIDDDNYEGSNLPPEDIYHYRNKIILGTKPSSNVQNVIPYIEVENRKEFLPVSVVLEDWKDKLSNSAYCQECQRLFSTQNALDSHKMTTHSLLVAVTKNVALKSTAKQNFAKKSTSPKVRNQARKSTGKVSSKFCNHCSKEFPDHTSLIKHLYELLPLNNFNCDKCDATFKNQKELMDHNAYHVKTEKSKPTKINTVVKSKTQPKVVTKSKVLVSKSKVLLKTKVPIKPDQKNISKKLLFEEDVKKRHNIFIIPKSVLFECSTCKLNFFTSLATRPHQDLCNGENNVPIYNCEICKKKIKVSNASEHKKQHELSSNIKTYKVTDNTYNRVLTECPKCHIYFTECSIIMHFKQNQCGKIPKSVCRTCQVFVPTVSFARHCQKHKKGFTKRDFIFVQNVMHRTVKRKLIASKVAINKLATSKPVKSVASKKVAIKSTAKSSLTKTSVKIDSTKANVNKLDTSKTSLNKSASNEKPQVANYNKRVTFYLCTHCKSVCKRKTRMLHFKKSCHKFKTMVCDKCGLQIRCEDFSSHMKLHYYTEFNVSQVTLQNVLTEKPVKLCLPNYHQCNICKIKFNNEKALSTHMCGEDYKNCKCGDKFEMTAYKMHIEYHKLNINNNQKVVFRCLCCDIVTDMYDKAVEHSQNHEKMVKTNKTIKCYICNLKFDDTSWQRHSLLHSDSDCTVTESDFKVLTYNPEELLTDEWLKLFQNLAANQTRDIIKNSLYSIERSIKMKLVKNGRVEYTLYVCSLCQICFENSEISTHLEEKCKESYGTCKICSLKFKDANSLEYHELLHKGMKNEEFRIVHFMKKKKNYVVYKCTGCYCCLTRKDSIGKHKCPKQNRNYKCSFCAQIYPKNMRGIHEKVHEENPDMNEKTIEIEYFDPAETESKTAKVFKCDCGLHFVSLPSVAKHVETCNGTSDIHSEKCSKCGLLFPTDILVSHLCKHHSNDMTIVIEEYRKVQSSTECSKNKSAINDFDYKLYKCGVCHQYFVSQSTCYQHVINVPHKSTEMLHECHICGLVFTGKSLYIHKRRHHEKFFNLNRVLVEEYHPATEDKPIKIDIFMATDKLQSLLVSSST